MTGVSLSRWSMAYFAAALVALLLSVALMLGGYGFPFASVESPRTLVVVHIAAIGWLSLLMCGALFQFVPVLVNSPLRDGFLTMASLLCLVAGLGALVAGFLWLDGTITEKFPFFPAAGALLGAGFALVIWCLGRTLAAGWPLPLPARFIAIGLAGLTFTAALGIVFALVLGQVTESEALLKLTAQGIPIHAIAGIGGWLGICALGVSYRLLAMFLLAPELTRRGTRATLYLSAGALAVAVPGGFAAVLGEWDLNPFLAAAGAAALGAFVFYGRDVLHLYRVRKRRSIELNMRMAALALLSLGLTALLSAVLIGFDALERHAAAIVFLGVFGWLSGLGLAKLYKIVPFMTWLECYGPVLGRVPTPRVQDLVTERRAQKWFLLYFAGVWGATAALLLEHVPTFRTAVAAMLIGIVGIILQLLRARRLVDVPGDARLPEGVHRPALFYSFVPKP
jgi:hypothetical protein